MRTIEGAVTIVQESRFQLVDRLGVARLFILAPGSGVEPDRLAALAGAQSSVRVRYAAAPGTVALLAKAVTLL